MWLQSPRLHVNIHVWSTYRLHSALCQPGRSVLLPKTESKINNPLLLNIAIYYCMIMCVCAKALGTHTQTCIKSTFFHIDNSQWAQSARHQQKYSGLFSTSGLVCVFRSKQIPQSAADAEVVDEWWKERWFWWELSGIFNSVIPCLRTKLLTLKGCLFWICWITIKIRLCISHFNQSEKISCCFFIFCPFQSIELLSIVNIVIWCKMLKFSSNDIEMSTIFGKSSCNC